MEVRVVRTGVLPETLLPRKWDTRLCRFGLALSMHYGLMRRGFFIAVSLGRCIRPLHRAAYIWLHAVRTYRIPLGVFAGVLSPALLCHAAPIIATNVTTTLGPDFFFDAAAAGGNDNNSNPFIRDITGYWRSNATVTLRGLGWASSATGTQATNAQVMFTDPGPDGAFGTGDDVEVGTVTDALIFSGANEYAWDFDTDMVFVASSPSLRIRIEGSSNAAPANIRRKTTSGSSADAVKLSLAGIAVDGGPSPVSAVALASGFWDSIDWDTGSGSVTGGLGEGDTASIGNARKVTYRGLPAGEMLAAVELGDNGHGYLEITSGELTVTGDVTLGVVSSANDGFVKLTGGVLNVGGSVHLGLSNEAADGTLEMAGGVVNIDGDLNLGTFLLGGSCLRFHNPGSSPAVQLGGKLLLGRASLALTFDTNYTHSPGATIDLVEYAARDGQFGNFRRGEEFNCGPNRFRINYDVEAGGGRKKIALTALKNWPGAKGPNIILLFADDQGAADLRLYGDNRYPMPRLESLAASGVKFTDAYVTGGVCHPSRCGLLTGRYQQRFGTDNNLGGPSYNGLATSQRTVPRRLQGLGYRTYGIGKWHLGTTVEYHPNQRGFDGWYGINAGSRSYYNASGEDQEFQEDEMPQPQDEGLYVTDRIGNACTNFIAEHLANYGTNQPFFIYVSFTAVHAPMDIQANDARFQRLSSEFGLTYASYTPEIVFSGSTAATTQQNRYELAAMSLALDENIGKIVDMVNATGLHTNTLIVYLNDNGGAGWNSSFGGNYSYNVPLRGYKGSSMTEGSIRVPGVASWSGTIPAGQTNATPVNSLDFMATFVNACGNAPAAARNGLDGLDLLPLMRDGTPLLANRVLCWRAGDVNSGGSAARIGDWKIRKDNGAGLFRLYNLATDVHEDTDVSAANPQIFNELVERFNAWDSGNIEPFYGADDMIVDADLERGGITGAYRIRNRTGVPAYLSASLRQGLSTASDFSMGFYLRPTETNHTAGAKLWFVLGDDTTRGSFIRAGVDFANGLLRLEEGRTGSGDSALLASLPGDWADGKLKFDASTRTLTFILGGTTVSLVLPGSYGTLDVYGCGAESMEGEVSRPFVPAFPTQPVESSDISLGASEFAFHARYTGDMAFGPTLARALLASGPYELDHDALIENLGGGLYQVTTPTLSSHPIEFFRVSFNRP